jgi:hypothetical protein
MPERCSDPGPPVRWLGRGYRCFASPRPDRPADPQAVGRADPQMVRGGMPHGRGRPGRVHRLAALGHRTGDAGGAERPPPGLRERRQLQARLAGAAARLHCARAPRSGLRRVGHPQARSRHDRGAGHGRGVAEEGTGPLPRHRRPLGRDRARRDRGTSHHVPAPVLQPGSAAGRRPDHAPDGIRHVHLLGVTGVRGAIGRLGRGPDSDTRSDVGPHNVQPPLLVQPAPDSHRRPHRLTRGGATTASYGQPNRSRSVESRTRCSTS